jgi:peptidoglycan/LPS O-acetylase OafA/YrhL
VPTVQKQSQSGMMNAPVRQRLAWVELGRGFAALAVVLYHASKLMKEAQYSGRPFAENLFGLGFLGVDFFFVLSGFIILHVHYADLGKPSAFARYGWRRLTRIFPTYWVVLALALVINLALQSDKAPVTPGWLLVQMMILPGGEPSLGLLLLVSRTGMKLPPGAGLLGAISYSLYLSHIVVMPLLLAVLVRLGLYDQLPETLIFTGQILVVLICAWALHRLLEQPLLAWAHSKFK